MANPTPTARDERSGVGIESALARNRAFAAANGHEGASLFPNLRLLVLELGDALAIRNNGGRVTPQVINDLAYVSQLAEAARPEGDLFEIAVIQHTRCGAARLADDAFRQRYAERTGADESSLREYAIVDPAGSVASDIDRLRTTNAISRRITVSGHVYDIDTGLIETVVAAQPVGDGGA
jgi:carbonic anhydrase